MTFGDPTQIALALNSLPFVTWDRMIEAPVGEGDWEVVVYGWIPRDDGRSDYVQVTFCSWSDDPGFTTSSAKHSEEIAGLLYGPGGDHFPCLRVEHELGDLVDRKVVLA